MGLLVIVVFSVLTVTFADLQVTPLHNSKDKNAKCSCEIINEADIDLKFFADLCKNVIEREMSTEAGIRKYRNARYPPPGMMERCRKKIQELCGIDITSALLFNSPQLIANATHTTKNHINISQCIGRLQELARVHKRSPKLSALPQHVHQERPLFLGEPPENRALREKGITYHHSFFYKNQRSAPQNFTSNQPKKPKGPTTVVFSESKEEKSKSRGILDPVCKLSMSVFFIFTVTKVLVKKPKEEEESSSKMNREVHSGNNSYRKEQEDTSLRSEAEMLTARDEITEQPEMDEEEEEEDEISENSQILVDDKNTKAQNISNGKIAVLEMETQAEFPCNKLSKCELTSEKSHAVENKGEEEEEEKMEVSESEEEAVVVTGRMLISLMGKGPHANLPTQLMASAEEA